MSLSPMISKYIENSRLNGGFCRWKKRVVNVYITAIAGAVTDREFYYSEVRRGISVWNAELKNCNIDIMLNTVNNPAEADITVHWTKVGRVFEGMCKYPSIINGEIKKVSIDIGLKNEYSGKNTTNESIFFVIMHEFGHALGLGHGVEIDDVMFVPHQKNISKPSENDLWVLKQIYSAA